MDLRDRAQAYKDTFSGSQAEVVLVDLSSFCAHTASTYPTDKDGNVIVPVDVNVGLIMEGRRQVWLWIKNLLSLDDEQLLKMQQAVFERAHITRRPLGRDWTI
jgi:hypothetical protein